MSRRRVERRASQFVMAASAADQEMSRPLAAPGLGSQQTVWSCMLSCDDYEQA
jgi:hypothetical protein